MEAIEPDFYSCITSHMYFKVFFVLVFGIILTFIDEIDIMKHKTLLYLVLVVLLMILLTHMDDYGYGVVVFIMLLFILTYNIQVQNTNQKNDLRKTYHF